MFTIYVESHTDEDEMPEQKDRVRVNLQKFGMIIKPYFDQYLNQEITESFFISQLDIGGHLPKFIINRLQQSLPTTWFDMFEKEAQRYQKQELEGQD